jgi:hypothetical protein
LHVYVKRSGAIDSQERHTKRTKMRFKDLMWGIRGTNRLRSSEIDLRDEWAVNGPVGNRLLFVRWE